MRVLVCGDRNWQDAALMRVRLLGLPHDTVVIHGAARGADLIAGSIARYLGLAVEEFPADWDKHGRAAGPIRNREMLDTDPHMVIAFHDDLEASKGTKDCVEEARRRGIGVEVWTRALLADLSAAGAKPSE